jgi:acyl-CoA synthetase (AMP-forming)/AMP-acid ligase II
MELLKELAERNASRKGPFLTAGDFALTFDDLLRTSETDVSCLRSGDVVALIGDFDARSLSTLLRLIDRGAVLVPLTEATRPEHEYFFEAASVDFVIEGGSVRCRSDVQGAHPLLTRLRQSGHPGLVLFSSGTTGRPKAILHDFTHFLTRYRTPRPTLRTLNFLLFDHIGGLNTFFHTIFNGGQVVAPSGRTPESVVDNIFQYRVELFPTTPTFLRLMLLEGALEAKKLESLKVITYGTERMDQPTLDRLCDALPHVDFRQTYGMSELGILRVKSQARNSLWMTVGGEGVETKVVEEALFIRSANRMLGYLNAPSPFHADGWYATGDLVEQDGRFLKIVGRSTQIINVGGVTVLPSEVERVALLHPDVLRAKARGVPNPLTGQHIEITCQPRPGTKLDRNTLRVHFREHLSELLRPQSIRIGEVAVSHRHKQE